ncbi:uncharacterized protein V6R79_004910 [Siganus canaliculatus]
MSSPTRDSTLLGLCDGELDPRRHQSSYLTNKVGGRPDWVPGLSAPWPRCGRCGAPLVHVVQVYCPLDASPFHRNLHLFACTGAGCGAQGCGAQGWRVLRSQCLETEAAAARSRPSPPQEAAVAATDWCDAADDWGVEEAGDGWGAAEEEEEEEEEAVEEAAEGAAPPDLSARLRGLSLGQSQDDVSPLLRPFFISVMDESDLCGDEDELRHAQQLLRDYESREGVEVGRLEAGEGGGGGGGEEQYEKGEARHGDAAFSRFRKRISLCPQQILRYCRGGKPLFVSEPPANMAAPACGSCGGPRTFELQLMPALVSLLQGAPGGSGAPGGPEAELEFGTVLVYTCRSSCWTTGSGSALDEFCLVQEDPDQQFFK